MTFCDLLFGFGHLLFGACPLVGQLRNAAVVLHLAVGYLPLALGNGRSSVFQLALRVIETLFHVGSLAFEISLLFVELLLGIAFQFVDARLLALGRDRFDAIHHLGHALVVGAAGRRLTSCAAHCEKRLGVGKIR